MKTLLVFTCVVGLCLAAPAYDDLLKRLEVLLNDKQTDRPTGVMQTRNVYEVVQDSAGIRVAIQKNLALTGDIRMTVYYTVNNKGYHPLAVEWTWDKIEASKCAGMAASQNGVQNYNRPACFTVPNPKPGDKYTFYTDTYVNGDRADPVHGTSMSIVARSMKKDVSGSSDKLFESLLKLLED